MADKVTGATRWRNVQPTKGFVFWACVATAAITVFVGFKWGGWVTGGSARVMAENSAIEARADLAAASCVARFGQGAEASARLAVLKKTDSWMRGTYMDEAGWATPIGEDAPVRFAGERCAERLLSTETSDAAATK